MIHFAHPLFFWLLPLPLITYYLFPRIKNKCGYSLRVPFLASLQNIQDEFQSRQLAVTLPFRSLKISLKFLYLFLIWFFLVVAISRPQKIGEPYRIDTENRDIMLVIDISTSMLQPDFSTTTRRIDRLSAVKAVVSTFVQNRTEDRIGLILFGTQAYLQAPLTFDKAAVIDILSNTDAGMAGRSTSIGDALGLALKTLKQDNKAQTNNKVIVLLTDGENNDGSLSMAQAIDLADKEKIKIYTIGVGADFAATLFNFRGNDLDEASLKQLAQKTAGTYFRATDLNSLAQIYRQIDALEPQKGDKNIVQDITELFFIPLTVAMILAIMLIFVPKRFLK